MDSATTTASSTGKIEKDVPRQTSVASGWVTRLIQTQVDRHGFSPSSARFDVPPRRSPTRFQRQRECYKVRGHHIDPVLVLRCLVRFCCRRGLVLSNCARLRDARSTPNETTTNQPNAHDDQQWETGVQQGDWTAIGIEFDMINQLDLNCVVRDRDQPACRTQ